MRIGKNFYSKVEIKSSVSDKQIPTFSGTLGFLSNQIFPFRQHSAPNSDVRGPKFWILKDKVLNYKTLSPKISINWWIIKYDKKCLPGFMFWHMLSQSANLNGCCGQDQWSVDRSQRQTWNVYTVLVEVLRNSWPDIWRFVGLVLLLYFQFNERW